MSRISLTYRTVLNILMCVIRILGGKKGGLDNMLREIMAKNMTNFKETIKTPYIKEAQYITSRTQTRKNTQRHIKKFYIQQKYISKRKAN